MASWLLFIGLFAALLYQIISKRTVEVHNVRASNEPDLVTFINDLEFNITTISSMTCSQLRGLGTVAIGNPGSIEYRTASLSTFAKYSCVNTTKGPTISLRCNNCQPLRDVAYVSWHFIDLPNNPASAVGFQFNLTARNHAHEKHLSFVRGALKNGSNANERAVTFRGRVPNILKFNLFPRIYHNMHGLKLIQPLFHEFLPGSSFSEPNELQNSLQSITDGLINTTLYINFLSDYIVEIDSQNILGPVSFFADLGGLFCFSMCIFFYLLVQCEYRVKKLRNEDTVMRKIRSRRKAQDSWDKLRKYVMYTWGPCSLEEEYSSLKNDTCCGVVKVKSSNRPGISDKQSQQTGMEDIHFSKSAKIPSQKALASLDSKDDDQTCFKTKALVLPPPPSLEHRDPNEIKVSDLQNDLQKLYEYNVILTEKLTTAQSMISAILKNESRPALESALSSLAPGVSQ